MCQMFARSPKSAKLLSNESELSSVEYFFSRAGSLFIKGKKESRGCPSSDCSCCWDWKTSNSELTLKPTIPSIPQDCMKVVNRNNHEGYPEIWHFFRGYSDCMTTFMQVLVQIPRRSRTFFRKYFIPNGTVEHLFSNIVSCTVYKLPIKLSCEKRPS